MQKVTISRVKLKGAVPLHLRGNSSNVRNAFKSMEVKASARVSFRRTPRGDSHIKRMGVLIGNFENKTLRGTKILSCGHGIFFFTPIRGTSKIKN